MDTSVAEIPKTIEELKNWYHNHSLPPADITRLFIDYDYKGTCAYGIYKKSSNGEFIVYKNKPDGSRYVKYSGEDESQAVKEFFMKMISELKVQEKIKLEMQAEKKQEEKEHLELKQMIRNKYNTNQNTGSLLLVVLVVILVVAGVFYFATSKERRYKKNQDYANSYLSTINK